MMAIVETIDHQDDLQCGVIDTEIRDDARPEIDDQQRPEEDDDGRRQ